MTWYDLMTLHFKNWNNLRLFRRNPCWKLAWTTPFTKKKRPTSPRSSLHKDPSNLHNSIRGVLAVPRLDHGIFPCDTSQQLQKIPFHLGVEFIFFIHLIFLHILGGATRNVSKNHPKKPTIQRRSRGNLLHQIGRTGWTPGVRELATKKIRFF